ncbi:MAG: quinol:cytochrome C oxidoreductase [Candidatus Riflebacteria bacterium]|nr:quinol:cytochrome C oxidoreductase [Candidatus Riflebacteria bacterium]
MNPSETVERRLLAVAMLGLIGMVCSFTVHGPARFWANFLLWFLFLLTVALGSLFVVSLEHLVGARWSVPIRRIPERISGLVVPLVPAALLALFSLPVLYPWARPGAVLAPIVAAKSAWLNVPFFAFRVVVCFALWLVSYRVLVGSSLEQDSSRDPALTLRLRRFAPVFAIFFGLTVTVVAFDWISSLEPEWYSDILGVYLFAGAFLAGLAATVLGVAYLIGQGRLPGVRPDHLYNLGAFLFAFTVFWSYIAFAQYLIMWYGNLPEEVYWYKHRVHGPWQTVTLILAIAHFLVPFLALIPRGSKGDLKTLCRVVGLVLGAHLLDLYWLIFPVLGAVPLLSWPELSFAMFFLGYALLWARRAMARGEDMPVGDPFLAEGLAFHL